MEAEALVPRAIPNFLRVTYNFQISLKCLANHMNDYHEFTNHPTPVCNDSFFVPLKVME